MNDKRINGTFVITFEAVGFHEASFDLHASAIEQYISRAGLPVYRARLSEQEARRGTRELCGMRTCQCGSALDVIDSEPNGDVWISVNPDMLGSHEWDEVMAD